MSALGEGGIGLPGGTHIWIVAGVTDMRRGRSQVACATWLTGTSEIATGKRRMLPASFSHSNPLRYSRRQ